MLYVLFLVLSFEVHVFAADVAESLKRSPCSKQILGTIQRYTHSPQWVLKARHANGPTIYTTTTGEIGVWLQLEFSQSTTTLTRVSPKSRLQIRWADRCVPRILTSHEQYDEKLLQDAFTDDTLKRLLDTRPAGVIYAWSPHMPYSLVGIDTIRSVTKKLGIALTLVMDPNADETFAKDQAKGKVHPSGFSRIESIELLNRGMTMHFPSLLVYAKGKFVSPLYPGVKSKKDYESFIKQFFAKSN